MWLLLVILVCLLALGIIQKVRHQKNINAIPIIINVNGTRGKTTVTRLITGMLKEAEISVVGKVSGTSERILYWDSAEEEEVVGWRKGSLIHRQIKLVKEAAKREADALVCECMAVDPDDQRLFQNHLLQGNIGVITNVQEDHMDVMGPTLDEVAEALATTIPYDGFLILSEGPYFDYFQEVAYARETEVILVDPSMVSEDILDEFDYIVFPENVALALGVAQILEIDEEIALRGMVKMAPDKGAMDIIPIGQEDHPSYFINGFAASDATSILNIWDEIEEIGYSMEDSIIIMNCQADRLDLNKQFITEVFPYISADLLIVTGENTALICEAYGEGSIPVNELYDCGKVGAEQIMEMLQEKLSDRVIIGMGTFDGTAVELIDLIHNYKIIQRVS